MEQRPKKTRRNKDCEMQRKYSKLHFEVLRRECGYARRKDGTIVRVKRGSWEDVG